MKIGILGSGDVGRRLGDGFIELGNAVKIGTRNPNKGEVIQWINKHGLEKDSFCRIFYRAGKLWGDYRGSNIMDETGSCQQGNISLLKKVP